MSLGEDIKQDFLIEKIPNYIFAFVIPIFITVTFLEFVVNPVATDLEGRTEVAEIFKEVPTQPFTYVLLSALVGLRACWHLRSVHRLDCEFKGISESSEELGLADRDWWNCLDLRRRAVALRTRGDFILYCGVLGLVGGVYFVIISLPALLDEGTVRVARGIFERQFGEEIDCVAKGECAYKLTGEFDDERDVPQPIIPDLAVSHELSMFIHEIGMPSILVRGTLEIDPEARLTAATLSEDGAKAIVGDDDGSVWMTTDSGSNWNRLELELRSREWLQAAEFSEDGATAIVGGNDGSVWMTTDSGGNWNRQEVELLPGERLTAATLSKDGATAIVGGNDGPVWMTTDSGGNWNRQEVELLPGERLMAATLSKDGATAIVGGNEGSVWMTTDSGKSWNRQEVELLPTEWLEAADFSEDGATAIVGGDEGSVWITMDSGKSWNRQEVELLPGELLTAATLSEDGATAIVGGDEGSVWITTNGETWNPLKWQSKPGFVLDFAISDGSPQRAFIMTVAVRRSIRFSDSGGASKFLDLLQGERVALTASNSDGTAVVFLGSKGTVWMTTDSGKSRNRQAFELRPEEQPTVATLSEDGTTAIVGGDEGSVWMTTDSGKNWNRPEVELLRTEWMEAAEISEDGTTAIVRGDEGSVWMTTDSGKNWNRPEVELLPGERLTATTLSKDGATAIVGGNRGSVWKRKDQGANWLKIRALPDEVIGEINRISFRSDSAKSDTSADETEPVAIIRSASGSFFAIKEHSELAGWKGRSDSEVQNEMRTDEILKYSELSKSVLEFFAETGQTSYSNNGERKWFDVILDRFAIVQAATLAILFFFVQMMIRLYQYNFRMAAFCESRADSLLIAHRFVGQSRIRFDDLVRVLAPDSYDFKAPPRSLFDRLQRTREP